MQITILYGREQSVQLAMLTKVQHELKESEKTSGCEHERVFQTDGFIMEFWRVDGILIGTNRKTAYLSIHLKLFHGVNLPHSELLIQKELSC